MSTRRFLPSSTRWLGVGIVLGLGGLLLVEVGLGTALDYLIAQSHRVGATKAFLLRAEYTMTGILLLITGVGVAWKAVGTGGETNEPPEPHSD